MDGGDLHYFVQNKCCFDATVCICNAPLLPGENIYIKKFISPFHYFIVYFKHTHTEGRRKKGRRKEGEREKDLAGTSLKATPI